MRLLSNILLCACIITAPIHISYANDEPDDTNDTPLITRLELGEVAPYAGTLFNLRAEAELIAQLKMNDEECKLKIDKELELYAAIKQLEIDILNARLESSETQFQVKLEILQDQNKYLIDRIDSSTKWYNSPTLWFITGFVIASGTTIAVTHAVNN